LSKQHGTDSGKGPFGFIPSWKMTSWQEHMQEGEITQRDTKPEAQRGQSCFFFFFNNKNTEGNFLDLYKNYINLFWGQHLLWPPTRFYLSHCHNGDKASHIRTFGDKPHPKHSKRNIYCEVSVYQCHTSIYTVNTLSDKIPITYNFAGYYTYLYKWHQTVHFILLTYSFHSTLYI
jgi:hypothetical protein